MSTQGHESEAIDVQGLKASLQKLKTNHVDGKAEKSTTLAGYGISDAYTKSETYTKTEVNGLVDTPHQEYVTADAYASLPTTGSKDTIYRVSSYNGSTSQVDASVYSEYAWNGSQYVFLCVKSQVGEVFDITVYNNNTKYADLTAALGTGGANIPESLRKGGMSVRFVQSSDNKYVQYMLASNEWNTDESNWIESGKESSLYQVPLNIGYYAITEIGSTMSLDILENSNYRCAKISCSQGDLFLINGLIFTTQILAPYAFTDANGKVLARYYGTNVTNGYAKAPSGTAYFVFSATRETAMLYYYPYKSAMAQAVYSILENSLFECTTAAATASKNITISGFQNFPITFDSGFHLLVKFTNNNTANNVTFKDDKPLYYNGARASAANTWKAGDILEMFNDGTNWYAKEATGEDVAKLNTAIKSLENTQIIEGIEEKELSSDGGTYTIGNVGTTVDLSSIDTSNNKGVNFIHSSYDCKEGDVFILTGSTIDPTVVLYAILDKDNKVIFRGESARSYSIPVSYTSAVILVPKDGVKFICNHYVNATRKLYYAEKKGAFATSYVNKSNLGYEHLSVSSSSATGLQYIFPNNALYYPIEGGIVLLNVNSGSSDFALHGHFLTEQGVYRTQSIIPLTTGTKYRLAGIDEGEKLIGISIKYYSASPAATLLDVNIYKNESYILERKANIPSTFTTSHIPMFDENGNPVDSGYDVNNLPHGSDLPSGGHDGEVLATDGNGSYYWVTVPTTTTTDVSQTFGVLVDQYESENTGVSWTPAIQRAVQEAGAGGTIVFTPNKTYNIDSTIHMLDAQVIIGNGATLRRMNESSTTVATAIDNSSTNIVELVSVPSDWKVGEQLFFYDSAQGLLGTYIAYANIAAINGNTITVTEKSTNPWTLSVGTKVTKSVPMLAGNQYPTPIGFKVYNLVFDGNKANNGSLLNWYIHGTVQSFGHNTVISDCKFYNIPTENIVTQGAMIRNNYAQDLNGSFVHLSCPSEDLLEGSERYMGTFVIGNMCNRVCCVDNDILRHSQAPVTYSWNAGKLIVIGNQFYGNDNSMCFQANVDTPVEPESSSEVSSNSYMLYTGNIFCNFKKIGEWHGGTAYIYPNQCKRMFTSNMFKDCGTNDMRSLYTKTNIMFEENKYEGNTVVNTDGNTLMYRVDTEISATPTASDLTTKYGSLPTDGEVYITQLNKLYKKIKTGDSTVVWLDESVSILS